MSVVSLGEIGSASVGAGSTSVVIPVGVNVPRSDPTAGASIVIVTVILDPGKVYGGPFVSDDAPEDVFYDEHIFDAGDNEYVLLGPSPYFNVGSPTGDVFTFAGLILNPLRAGVNNISFQVFSGTSEIYASAVAFTGCNVDTNPTLGYWPQVCPTKPGTSPFMLSPNNGGAHGHPQNSPFGILTPVTPPGQVMLVTAGDGSPSGGNTGPMVGSPGGWEIDGSDLLLAWVTYTAFIADPIPTDWNHWNGPFTTIAKKIAFFNSFSGTYTSFVLGTAPGSSPLVAVDSSGEFDIPSGNIATPYGAVTGLRAGPGPIWCPGPAGPTLRGHFRLS